MVEEARLEVSHLDWFAHNCDLIPFLKKCRDLGHKGVLVGLGAAVQLSMEP